MKYYTASDIYKFFSIKKALKYPLDALCTQNISWCELFIHQNEVPPLFVMENLYRCAKTLQYYRNTYFKKAPITITSGWRSNNYNTKIGGSKNSYHCKGMAIDFVVQGFSPNKIQKILNPVHKGGLEFAAAWTHIDIRPEPARFDNKGNIYPVSLH